MCYRESFCLFPLSMQIPVAWTVSYHHEDIIKALNPDDYWRQRCYNQSYFKEPSYIQIECREGDIKQWDWDNTPFRYALDIQVEDAKWVRDECVASIVGKVIKKKVYELPSWLEDNLKTYEDRIERILERANPLRDKQDQLAKEVIDTILPFAPGAISNGIMALFQTEPRVDSMAVQEFIRIINGYLEIPGFVMREKDFIALNNKVKAYNRVDFDWRKK